MESYDVVVIGAGPGGYSSAIRASQLGFKVAVVDKGTIGGECLNWGCIPSKALISAADFYYRLRNKSDEMGIIAENVSVDMLKLQKWKEKIQKDLVKGVESLLASYKVTTIIGEAKFEDKHTIKIKQKSSQKKVTAKFFIIAVGTEFLDLRGFKIDEKKILTARGVLELKDVPEHLICIGGGIIGLELGTVYAKLGSKVTVVELMPTLLPGINRSLTMVVERNLRKMGVEILKHTGAESVTEKNGALEVVVANKEGKKKTLNGDVVLVSIGKKSINSKIGLNKAGVQLDKQGFINVDHQLRTSVSHIFAIGDCIGPPFLAHRSMKQGVIAAEVIAGHVGVEADFKAMPVAIFTDPEIAFVGMTESEAKQKGYSTITGRAPFLASGRAKTQQESHGFVEVVKDSTTDTLLGVQIVGPHASDLISEAALALELGASVEDIGFTVHPHPTLPEMVMEAAEATLQKAIHVANTKVKKK